jgi:hypothetical protein
LDLEVSHPSSATSPWKKCPPVGQTPGVVVIEAN